jgi:ribosome hibernation promoting factor
MSPRIMCHHHSLSDADREFITGKVSNLKKYFERIVEVSVILDATKNECLTELLMFGPHTSLRVKNNAGDMRTAFEGALNKAERTLTKARDKRIGNKRHSRRNVTIRRFDPQPESEAPPEGGNGISQTTVDALPIEHVEPRPMAIEDALTEMLKTKSGILVFVNPKTEEINLLHRNADNQVELVELTGTVLFQPAEMEIAEGQ